MATAQDIIDDIKSDLTLVGSEYDSQLLRAIKSALRELRGKRYWFLKGYGSITSTAGSLSADISDTLQDFSVIVSADLVTGGIRYTNACMFKRMTFEELRAQHWRNDPVITGRPTAFAVEGNTIYFSHTCAEAYQIDIQYCKQDAVLPVAGSTSLWFDDGYDVIRSMAQYIFKRDAQGMMANEADADMVTLAITNLDNAHTNRVAGGF